jgi:protein associated with RNAse G/E
MKYIYVLASSENDLYYEQFFLSAVSLRLCNPVAEIILLLDVVTKNGLTGNRAGYEKIVSNIIVIEPPKGLSQKETSRWIKTSMRQYITGDFLYIDCDTIITDNLDCVFSDDIKIGAILDSHIPFAEHHYYRQFRDESLKLGFDSILTTATYYNGGIIIAKDNPEAYRFFERWHSLWKECQNKGNSQDMPSFNRANYELHNIITEIGGEWNCQICNNGLPFLYHAKILHYFATSLDFLTSPFILASKSVLSSIKKTGTISTEILEKLKNPKTAFELNSKIVSDRDVLKILDSSIFSVLRRLRKRNEKMFEIFDTFVYRLTAFLKQKSK